ncbi:MAG: hypothetical protein WCX90_09115 [Thiohalomonadaceae bacterium]|jgi:predicted RNase H-like nuclease (RuvC/YqgF family)
MGEIVRKFMATDAMSYVDTYRRLIMTTPGDIKVSRERIEARLQEMNLVPSRLYAELCAHEHALNFVLKKQEPGMVILGEAQAEQESDESIKRDEERQQREAEVDDLRRKLKHAAQQYHELEVELVERRQEVASLNRKLAQTYNTFAVSGIASITVLLVLVGLIFRQLG